jgi:hypothetical protein
LLAVAINKSKHMITFWLALIGSVIVVTSAYIDAINKIKEREQALRNEEKRSNEYAEIIRANNEIINNLNGGNNMPFIFFAAMPSIYDTNYYEVEFRASNNGKYPIKNLQFQIHDYFGAVAKVIKQEGNFGSFSGEYEFVEKQHFENYDKNINVGDLPIHSFSKEIYKTKFIIDLKFISYNFTIQWQNGEYYGKISGERTEDKRNFIVKIAEVWGNGSEKIKDLISVNKSNQEANKKVN